MEKKTIFFNAKVEPVKPINQEFTLCKVYICALDKNRNLSYISKEAAEAALPTLYNCPVIGHIYEDEDGVYHMGGHDLALEQDNEGRLRFKSLCVPYGVIHQQDNIRYEEVVESNGKTATYIVGDAILWTGRFPELKEVVYSDECWFGQSMEIAVEEHCPLAEDQNYTNILKYSYSALCLLGKSDDPEHHTEPCFRSSRVEPYEFALDNAQFTELMTQFKDELAICFAHAKVEKGGENMNENEAMDVTVEETVVEPEVAEEPVEATADAPEAVAEFSEDLAEHESTEDVSGVAEEASEEVSEPEQFTSTYEEKRRAICNALPCIREINDDELVIHEICYWLCDFDDTFAYVEESEYVRESGFTQRKGRFAYTFDEEAKTVTVNGEFEKMTVKWLTEKEVEMVESQRAQYEELVAYKEKRETADREAEMDNAISEFAYMSENEEYQEIFKNRYSFESVKALQDACYIVKGKYSIMPPQQRKPATEPSVRIGEPAVPQSIHERFHAEYANK